METPFIYIIHNQHNKVQGWNICRAGIRNYSLLWLKCEPNCFCCLFPMFLCVALCAQVWCSGLGVLQQWLSPSQTTPSTFVLISTGSSHHDQTEESWISYFIRADTVRCWMMKIHLGRIHFSVCDHITVYPIFLILFCVVFKDRVWVVLLSFKKMMSLRVYFGKSIWLWLRWSCATLKHVTQQAWPRHPVTLMKPWNEPQSAQLLPLQQVLLVQVGRELHPTLLLIKEGKQGECDARSPTPTSFPPPLPFTGSLWAVGVTTPSRFCSEMGQILCWKVALWSLLKNQVKEDKNNIKRSAAAPSQLGFGFPDTPNPQDIFKLWNSDEEFGFILTVVIHSLSWSLMPQAPAAVHCVLLPL